MPAILKNPKAKALLAFGALILLSVLFYGGCLLFRRVQTSQPPNTSPDTPTTGGAGTGGSSLSKSTSTPSIKPSPAPSTPITPLSPKPKLRVQSQNHQFPPQPQLFDQKANPLKTKEPSSPKRPPTRIETEIGSSKDPNVEHSLPDPSKTTKQAFKVDEVEIEDVTDKDVDSESSDDDAKLASEGLEKT